ncbi:MAG: PHP domain-containing protein [Bacilli bacterium]|nr:PHP domain-containing protein [Bacilli bacterium]
MDKLIDMHVHTNYSDGQYSPDEVIKLGIEAGVGVMAITDHDTLDGIKNVDRNKDFIRESGIKIVNGIEISAHSDTGTMHILGYDIDLNNKELNNKLKELRTNRMNSTLAVMEQIRRDYGITFSYYDIIELVNSRHVGRPGLAKLCVKYGFSESISDAFDNYLNPAKEKTRKYSKNLFYPEVFKLVKDAGGIVIFAHPKTLKLDNYGLDRLIFNMKNHGLDGIEVYNSIHNLDDVKFYKYLADKYNLLISGGTDFHGPLIKPNIEIGTGYGNIKIKRLSLVDELKRRGAL